MKLRKKTTPVDKGWIDDTYVTIDVSSLSPTWGYKNTEAYRIINAMHAHRPDVFDREKAGITRDRQLIKLPVMSDYDNKEAFAVVATLWQVVTDRAVTLHPGQPPTTR